MSKVHEQIRYLEAKRKYEKLLREKRELKEYAQSGLFAVIGDALGDIFKSLKLTAMDISNELRFLGEKFLYRNNPAKLKEAGDNYNRKRDKILKEWEPIVKKNMDAIKNADPFLTITLAPSTFLISKSLQAGVAAGKTAAEIIAAEDWESMRANINKFQTGTEENPNAGVEMGIGAIHDQMAQQNNLLMQLNNLFMGRDRSDPGAARVARGDLEETSLVEQEKKQDKKITDPEEWLETFFKMTGIDEQFTDAAADDLAAKTELMSEMIDSIAATTAIKKLVSTSSLEEFKTVISDIVSSKKVSSDAVSGFSKTVPQIEDQAKKIAQSEDFRNEVAESKNVAPEEIDPEELYKTALGAVFKKSKSSFDEEHTESIVKYTDVIEKNHELVNVDDQVMKLIEKRKGDLYSAEDYLKVYDQYSKAYKDFKQLQ